MPPRTKNTTANTSRPLLAFLFAAPIAVLGGLIGLGGAEFRLPVLIGPLRYTARQAVPLNLAVSLITILTSLLVRSRTLSFTSVKPFLFVTVALIVGGVITAFIGPSLASRLSKEQFERTIVALLFVIGGALVIEGFLPQQIPALLPATLFLQLLAGILFGLAIGLVSSLLGVAGGELIIPTLVFAYGVDIKTAGTTSLLISLPTVCVGILRYAAYGVFRDRGPLRETVWPMALGSILGALIGGYFVSMTPTWIIKIGLGIILIVSAGRMFQHSKPVP